MNNATVEYISSTHYALVPTRFFMQMFIQKGLYQLYRKGYILPLYFIGTAFCFYAHHTTGLFFDLCHDSQLYAMHAM